MGSTMATLRISSWSTSSRVLVALLFASLLATSASSTEQALRAQLFLIDANGITGSAGEVLVGDSPDGVRLLVEARNLPPGTYRLQIHQGSDCGPGPDDTGAMAAGVLAGEPWAPADGTGDAGMVEDQPPPSGGASTTPLDLPELQVREEGHAYAEIVLPQVSDALQLWYRSFVVHAPDGARIACGVVG
jgi:Cu-Zn family superoxide dismutase